MHIIKFARSIVAVAVVGAVVALGSSPAVAATGDASTTTGPVIGLSALQFSKPHVDSRSSAAIDTLTRTVTDSEQTATNLGGHLFIRLERPNGTYPGVPIDVPFALANELINGGQFVSGTAQKSTYTFDFPVPSWAPGPVGTWIVSEFSATDGTNTVDAPVTQFSSKFRDTVIANENADRTAPFYSPRTC